MIAFFNYTTESKDYIEIKDNKGNMVRFPKDRVEKLDPGRARGTGTDILVDNLKTGRVGAKPTMGTSELDRSQR